MKSKKRLTGIEVVSFVTTALSENAMRTIAGGEHPTCPTDGGPDTEVPQICNIHITKPKDGCMLM